LSNANAAGLTINDPRKAPTKRMRSSPCTSGELRCGRLLGVVAAGMILRHVRGRTGEGVLGAMTQHGAEFDLLEAAHLSQEYDEIDEVVPHSVCDEDVHGFIAQAGRLLMIDNPFAGFKSAEGFGMQVPRVNSGP
jgi:hypothetical protein